jgi:hypothetical protein
MAIDETDKALLPDRRTDLFAIEETPDQGPENN